MSIPTASHAKMNDHCPCFAAVSRAYAPAKEKHKCRLPPQPPGVLRVQACRCLLPLLLRPPPCLALQDAAQSSPADRGGRHRRTGMLALPPPSTAKRGCTLGVEQAGGQQASSCHAQYHQLSAHQANTSGQLSKKARLTASWRETSRTWACSRHGTWPHTVTDTTRGPRASSGGSAGRHHRIPR